MEDRPVELKSLINSIIKNLQFRLLQKGSKIRRYFFSVFVSNSQISTLILLVKILTLVILVF